MSPAFHYLLYDEQCSLCQRFRDWVVRQDRDKRIEPVGFQDPRVSQIAPGLVGEKLFGSMHLIGPNGQIVSGHRAVPQILKLLPKLGWLGRCIEMIPGSDWVSEKLYGWIAAHRFRL
jgi:predicted DCC family thiol-disulfide oxidoreductase YuxK